MNKLVFIIFFIILTINTSKAETVMIPSGATSFFIQRSTSTQEVNDEKDIDLGPYIRNLQRTVRLNWNPHDNSEQKRVVASFVITKNGNLLNCLIKETSGDKLLDEAAIIAIKKSAPFPPLPFNLKEDDIEIQFTFGYNVLGASRIK